MIFVEDNYDEQQVIADQEKTDTGQDIKIDSLQTAVDALNVAVTGLQGELDTLGSSIDDRFIAEANTLHEDVVNAINDLEATLAANVNTEQIVASDVQAASGSIDDFDADTIEADSATIETVTADDITVTDTLTVQTQINAAAASVTNATIQYLTAASAAISSYNITDLSTTNFDSVAAYIDVITAEVANIARLNANLITVSDSGLWHQPIGAPDNTELLKITIPAYQGMIDIISENGELNVSILNGTTVSFNHDGSLIHRIEFDSSPNIEQSYNQIVIAANDTFTAGVPDNIEGIEFTYKGAVYRYATADLNTTVDSDLSISYSSNTLTFTAGSNEVDLTEVLIFDSSLSGKNDVILYLTDTVNYKELYFGESFYRDSYSELVEKTGIVNNITARSGTIVSALLTMGGNVDVQIVNSLPGSYAANTIYVVTGDASYYSADGVSVTKMGASVSDVNTNTAAITAINNSLGQANGIATLDANGHIPAEQMPTEALIYKGQWDASSGAYPVQVTYTTGDFYIVSVAGTVSGIDYYVGDWIIWNGAAWDRSANANLVYSVNGQQGTVVIDLNDLNGQEKLVSGTNIKTLNNNSILGAGNITLADLGITIV